MINSNNSGRRGGNSSTVSSPSLPQCLPLEPITLGNQKYTTRSGELRRVLEVNSSFGIGHSKPTTPLATEELRNFKESVQDTTKKARCRAKVLEQSISKLDEYREVLGSVKRQRTDLLSSGRSSGGNSSMHGQILRNPQDQRSEEKTNVKTTGLGPKTRIRTSMLGARTDGRATRQQVAVVKDREHIIKGSSDVQIEEKMQRLPVGGSGGWDRKMTRKRSVGGTVGDNINNRSTNGSRDIKRATLVKPTDDSEFQSVDTQGFRSNASAGISGITVVESSMLTNSSSRLTPKIELETIIDETVVGNGKIKANIDMESPAGSPISVKKSRTARTSSGEQPTNRNKSPTALGFENNQKRPISTTTSSSSPAQHMAQWVGQRPLKISRTRRSSLTLPVSNANGEAPPHISTQAFPPSDLIAGTPHIKSEGEEHREGEIKLLENGSAADEVGVNADHKDRNFVSQPRKNKVLVNRGAGEKIKNLPVAKPLQGSRRIPDKNRSKSGQRSSKNRKAAVRAGSVINCASTNFTGESDDCEQLLAAAKYARNASNLACSSPFWKKMEYYFASITSRDALYLKDQLNLAEELNRNLSQMLDDEHNVLSVLMNKENSFEKPVKNKAPSLYQRLLSALIEDDENEEPCLQSEVRNTSFQSASDDSHCGSCNHIDTEPKVRDKVECEVESGANLQSHKHILDRNSCNKSASSNTNGSFSNNEQWQADDGLSHSSQIDGCVVSSSFDHQYEMLSIDDRLLMELQSIGLSPVIMPHLEEREELNQDINELQATRFQQVKKMKKHLGKIDKAIPYARDADRRNMEQVAMNQLIEMAYKRRMAYRGSQSSNAVIRRVSKQAGLAFARRTLDRCRKFEDTGTGCFADPAIQDFLFSAPPSRNSNPLKSTHFVPSTTAACNTHNKRKEMLLDDVISNGKNGDTTATNNNNRSKKAMPKQSTTTHPTGPFNRSSGQTAANTLIQRREEEELMGFENGFGPVDLGGPQGVTDLSSFLDFDEAGFQDEECVGLEIPMDDLTDLQMLM